MTGMYDHASEDGLVLIVDDEPTTRMLMREALDRGGLRRAGSRGRDQRGRGL